MKLALVAVLAALALPSPAQDTYAWFELVPPASLFRRTPLFDRAFTSGRYLTGVAADRAGNVYVFDNSTLQKITPDGKMAPLMGYGPATLAPGDRVAALLTAPSLFASFGADSKGNLYFGDSGGAYRLRSDGTLERFTSIPSSSVSVDAADNLYVLSNGNRVVRIAQDGAAVTVAGLGESSSSGDGGPATAATFLAYQMAVDPAGNIWLADTLGKSIRRIDRDGTIRKVADAPNEVTSLAADSAGNLYFAGYSAASVQRLSPSGEVRIVAGSIYAAPYRGDGGPAQNAFFPGISGLAVDGSGALYIATGQRLSKVDADGVLHTIAGCLCGGEDVPSNWAQLGSAAGLVRDAAGNTYFSDQPSHVVRRISPEGILTTVAGTGESGYSGDGGPAREARLSWPAGLAIDSAGAIYIADEQNNRIRKFTPGGSIQTVAGNGNAASLGDGGPAVTASVGLPDGVAVDPAGNVYIADTASHRIRKVTPDGVIQTIAGADQYGTSGDGGPALQALLINPRGLAVDAAGNLLLTDSSAHMIRRVTPDGRMERVAGTGQAGTSVDGGLAIAAQLDLPWGIAADAAGNVYFGDGYRTRKIDTSGRIQTIGYPGGTGVAADSSGRVWVASSSGVGVLSRSGAPYSLRPVITNATISAGTSAFYLYPQEARSVVAPGEFVTISGLSLGVMQSITANPPATNLGGFRVYFDEFPAPILSVGYDGFSVIAPFAIAGRTSVGVSFERDGQRSNSQTIAVLPSVPAPFVYAYGTLVSASALNQDGKPNTMYNLAARGSVISLFATGAGTMTPPLTDGLIVTGAPLSTPVLPVAVSIGDHRLEVLWAGAAPSQVAGVLQVNVRLPSDLAPSGIPFVSAGAYPLELWVGNAKSRTVNVWVAQ